MRNLFLSGRPFSWLFASLALALSVMPHTAHAAITFVADDGVISHTLQRIVSDISGSTGKAISAVAIIALGIAALMGKLSKEYSLLVAAGIALIFGGANIVKILGASNMPTNAFTIDPVGFAIDQLVVWMTSNTGIALATLAIMILGIGAVMGKVNKEMGITVAAGIGIVFGAVNIVHAAISPLAGLTTGLMGVLTGVTGGPIGIALGTLIGVALGSTGQAIATLAVIFVGIGAMLGKLSKEMAILVVIGIALFYGAAFIVLEMGGIGIGGLLTIFGVNGSNDPVVKTMNNVVGLLNGPVGMGLATIAVMAMGVAAMMGRLPKERAVLFAVGVGLMFGTATLITTLSQAGMAIASLFNFGNTASDPIAIAFNNVSAIVNGPLGVCIATLAVIVLGMGAMFGKISYPMAIMTAVGFGIVFGAGSLIQSMKYVGTAGPISNNDAISTPLNIIVNEMTGPAGTAIATLAVILLGFATFFGKISFPTAFISCAGIAILFGAATIVDEISNTIPSNAMAGTSLDPFTNTVCKAMTMAQGPSARAVGTLAVMALGIGAMMGKISWEKSFMIIASIAVIYGAGAIVNMIAPTSLAGTTCSSSLNTGNSSHGAIVQVLCTVVDMLVGPAGKALASIAIVVLGFGGLFGKVNYQAALTVVIGIAIMFGAGNIVIYFFGNFGNNTGVIFNGTGVC